MRIQPKRELDLTGGLLLAENSRWTFGAQVASRPARVLAIPILVRELGVDRFALLTLAWTVVGYFSLLISVWVEQ
jgi:O-antigen/teichoic acid export membrane protein